MTLSLCALLRASRYPPAGYPSAHNWSLSRVGSLDLLAPIWNRSLPFNVSVCHSSSVLLVVRWMQKEIF